MLFVDHLVWHYPPSGLEVLLVHVFDNSVPARTLVGTAQSPKPSPVF